MTEFDYAAWRTSIEQLLAPAMDNFTARFGYPPDDNEVVPASPENVAVAEKSADVVPGVLVDFYRHFSEVSLPDVHNGLFIHPLRQVLANETNGTPVRAPQLTDGAIVVFGSDGGGTLFALAETGAPVYFLPPGAVADGVYRGGLQEPAVLTATFTDFLDWLTSVVAGFAR